MPPPPSYATDQEAKEWDDYYRYCARGALFKALDKGRMTELELGQELAKIASKRNLYRATATTRSTTMRRHRSVARPRAHPGCRREARQVQGKAVQGATKCI